MLCQNTLQFRTATHPLHVYEVYGRVLATGTAAAALGAHAQEEYTAAQVHASHRQQLRGARVRKAKS